MKNADSPVVEGTTCFSEHSKRNITCNRRSCREWINDRANCNCALISAHDGPKTLEQVGNAFGLTRMRICQIEKAAMRKFLNVIQSD